MPAACWFHLNSHSASSSVVVEIAEARADCKRLRVNAIPLQLIPDDVLRLGDVLQRLAVRLEYLPALSFHALRCPSKQVTTPGRQQLRCGRGRRAA